MRDLRGDAFDASPLSLLVLDGSDRVALANSAACAFLGTEPGALVGTPLAMLAHPDQRSDVTAMIDVARSGHVPTRREVWFVRPDNSPRLGGFSVSSIENPGSAGVRSVPEGRRAESIDGGEAGHVVVVIRDITHERQLQDEATERARLRLELEAAQRREAEGTAERAEMGLRLLINTIPDLAFVHRDGRIVHANQAAVAALGYDHASDLIGTRVFDHIHPDDQVVSSQRISSVVETGAVAPPRGMKVKRKAGGHLEVEFLSLPIAFRNQPVVLSLGRDLTERKKLEAQLALGERLVAMGRLVAGIGHEINNPLSYVMANLEMVVERLRTDPPDGEIFELLADCRDGADRIHRIIKGLKGLSRGGDRPVPIDIRRLLERAIAMTRNEVRHRAQLVCRFDDIPDVMADETRLAQVFVNLLVNAAQSIPAGQATTNEVVVTTCTDARGHARIEIRDSGCGIAEDNLKRIFDPFFTTKAVGVGTGLGLSISHSIVTEYGGSLDVESQVGRGTTFSVILPPAPRHVVPTAVPVEVPAIGMRGRVLVIDDEPAIGLAVRRALASEHEVVIAGSGRDAIARLEAGEAFDAILCDLMMPEVTGMDVHAWLTQRRPAYLRRIVFLSGGAFTDAANDFVRNGEVELLDKPFVNAELRTRVRAVVERAP